MSTIICSTTASMDGSIKIPSTVVRGLGYEPGDKVDIQIPSDYTNPSFLSTEDGLMLVHGTSTLAQNGYGSDSDRLCIPFNMMAQAGIPDRTPVFMVAGDGILVIVAHESDSSCAADEIAELCIELGMDVNEPVLIEPES